MAELLNLDENSNLITDSYFVQDFREVHSKCTVKFPMSEELDFNEGDTFLLWGQEWEAVSYKEISLDSSWQLSVMGYPKSVCTPVLTKHLNLSSLAQGMGLSFDSSVSSDFQFEFPLRSIPLCHLLYKYRYSSFERFKDNVGDAWFLFCDGRGLVGQSYRSMLQISPLEFDMSLSRYTGGSYSLVRDLLNVRYESDYAPSVTGYSSLATSLIKDKFDFQNVFPCIIGARYNFVGSEDRLLTESDNLILVRQEYDSKNAPVCWNLTFGQLEV